MHRILVRSHGGPEVLRLEEFSSTPLIAGQVRIRVRATGVNFADVQMRMGLYPEAPKPPMTPGYEISGEVVEASPGVSNLRVGDRILAFTQFGGYCDETVLDAANVLKIPSSLSFIDAAAIPVNFATAWVALHEQARVRKGDRVLVHSAAGGVGVAAVQMAKNAGAHVTGFTGSPGKEKFLRELGCDEVLFAPPGAEGKFDVVLDAAGGATSKKSYASLAPLGRVVFFGVNSIVGGSKRSLYRALKLFLTMPWYTPMGLMMANKGVFGLNMLKFAEAPEKLMESVASCLAEVASGRMKPVIGATFPLKDASLAHAHLQSRGNIGKVVLVCD